MSLGRLGAPRAARIILYAVLPASVLKPHAELPAMLECLLLVPA